MSEVYPDGGYDDTYWMAFDPDVRFPRFLVGERDETIGKFYRATDEPENGLWQWSMTVALPGQASNPLTNGREADKVEAGRQVITCYRDYLRTRPNRSRFKRIAPRRRYSL